MVSYSENLYEEAGRLDRRAGLLERLRTQEIVNRDLSIQGSAKLSIADVGGGPGVYAQWLAHLGHHVKLIDPVLRHVHQTSLLDAGAGSMSVTPEASTLRPPRPTSCCCSARYIT